LTDNEFQNDFLLSINKTLGDMRGAMGRIEGRVEYAIQLHETCPARLGYDALKDTATSFKLKTRDSKGAPAVSSPMSAFLKSVAPYLWKGALIFGLAVGGSIVARFSTSDADQKPTINAIQAIAEVVAKTEKGVAQIGKIQALDVDAGQ